MNIHVPQSIEAENEMIRLSHLATQIISPKNSLPVMGLVQDGLLGLYIFGKYGFLSVKNMMKMMNDLGITADLRLKKTDSDHLLVSSTEILNQTLPKITVINPKKRDITEDMVKYGELEVGKMIESGLLKAGKTGLFHITFADYGPKVAKNLFDHLARIATNWLLVSGFSIGILDCMPNTYIKERIKSVVNIYDDATQYLVDYQQLKNVPKISLNEDEKEFNKLISNLSVLLEKEGYTYTNKSQVERLLAKIYYPLVINRLRYEMTRLAKHKDGFPESHRERLVNLNASLVFKHWVDKEKGYVCTVIGKLEMSDEDKRLYDELLERVGTLQKDEKYHTRLVNLASEFEKMSRIDLLGKDNSETTILQLEALCAFVQTLIYIVPGSPDMSDRLEEKLYELTQKSTNIVNGIISENVGFYEYQGLDRDYFKYTGNSFNTMYLAQSKGNTTNIGQIAGLLGQQDLEGKRQGNFFYRRSLPHYPKDSIEPKSRGYVHNSFLDGLTMLEYFSHAQAGRLNQIDKTIKSVTPDTDIVLLENGRILQMTIGEWVDRKLDLNKDKVIHQKEKEMEILKLTEDKVYIPTCDEDGNVSWGEITIITRHDPGLKLYEVKTLGGRSVIVTESKSLLIYNKKLKKFLHTSTPDVVVGDYMPVTATLSEPVESKTEIDMTNFFPKTEYIYGTDFLKAQKMLEDARRSSVILKTWWYEHNGKEFTLPYTNVQRFIRTLGRSDISNIKEGFLYSYHASRTGKLPDKFTLDYDNGLFLGLFLAEGNVDEKSGYVQITNNERNILEFVKRWFDNMEISNSEKARVNRLEKISRDVRGHSTLLARFLDILVGHGAAHKRVPDDSFVASKDFIRGLISGYISGDGTITENSIVVGSASPILIHGINMICSRLGIFGKVTKTDIKSGNLNTPNPLPRYSIAIRAQWASQFMQEIELIDSNKQIKLEKLKPSIQHTRFPTQNDVVLDKIVEINEVEVERYPKVYDLTIPSTLNFGLANGLHVVDTADTGYLQRKLIKMMEGLVVHYDGTVRNSSKNVIQKLYGGDAVDPQQLESIGLELTSLRDRFYFSGEQLDGLKEYLTDPIVEEVNERKDYLLSINGQYESVKSDVRLLNDLYGHLGFLDVADEIGDDHPIDTCRKKEASKIFGYLPVNFERLVHNNYYRYQLDKREDKRSDLNPLELIEKINTLIARIEAAIVLNAKEHMLLFRIAINSHLSVRQIIKEYGFHKQALDTLLEDIYLKYCRSLVAPGESIGIISAQSIGEPLTQMTLNKFHAAGVGKASSKLQGGVPRLGELLGLTRKLKTPSMSMRVSDYYMLLNDLSFKGKSSNVDMNIINQIKSFDFKSIVKSSEICYDPKYERPVFKPENFYVTDNGEDAAEPETMPWVIYFQIKLEKKREMRADMIFSAIDNLIRTSNKYKSERNYVIQVAYDGLTRKVREDEVDKTYLENYVVIRCHSSLFDEDKKKKSPGSDNILSNLIDLKNDIMKLNIKGLNGISDVFVEKEGNKKMVLTIGSSLSSIIENPVYTQIIDVNQITSNDVVEIEQLYGIEAARNCFIQEMYTTLQSDLNVRHIELLADNMSHLGELLSVNRFGVKRGNNEPLHRASFEETTKQFIDSSLYTEKDPMTGPSANVMFGQFIHSGTNAFSIVLDTEKLLNLEPPSWQREDVDPFDKKGVSSILVSNTTKLLVEHLVIEDLFAFKFELAFTKPVKSS